MPTFEHEIEVRIQGSAGCTLALGSGAVAEAHGDGYVVWRASPEYRNVADMLVDSDVPYAPGGVAFITWFCDPDMGDTIDYFKKWWGRNAPSGRRPAVVGDWGELDSASFDYYNFPLYTLYTAVRVDSKTMLMVWYSVLNDPDPGWDPDAASPAELFSLVPGLARR